MDKRSTSNSNSPAADPHQRPTPTKKLKTFSSSVEGSEHLPDSAGSSSCDLSKDLELLQQNVSGYTEREREELRSVLTPFVGRAMRGMVETNIPINTSVENKDTTNTLLAGDSARVLIRQTIRLMIQFENACRREPETGMIDVLAGEREDEPCNLSGLTRDGMKRVLLAFEDFFNRQLTYTERKSPVTIDLLLQHIFGYLPLADLQNCRLVSRHWNLRAVPCIRSRHSAIWLSDPDLPSLLDTLQNSPVLPFTSFRICAPLESLNFNDSTGVVLFLSTLGECVKELTVGASSPTSSSDFECIRRTLRNVPNLEVLKLEVNPGPGETGDSDSELTGVPSTDLEEFKLLRVKTLYFGCSESEDEDLNLSSEFMEALLTLLPNLEWLNLNNMELDQSACTIVLGSLHHVQNLVKLELRKRSLPSSAWDHLTQQKHKLKSLTMPAGFSDESGRIAISRFLTTQKDCLEELNITSEPKVEGAWTLGQIEFLPMTKLKRLELLHYIRQVCDYRGLGLRPVRFKELRTLTCCWECLRDVFEPGTVFPALAELCLLGFDNDEGDAGSLEDAKMEQISRMGQIFPNVTKFKTYQCEVYNEFLDVVFTQFPKVEELDLELAESEERRDINYLVGGLGESDYILSRVREQMGRPDFETLLLPFCFNPETAKASLRDLKCLKKLRLKFTTGFKEHAISDMSVYTTFLRMNRLSQLILEGNIDISKNGAAKLVEFHSNVILIPVRKEHTPE